MGQKQSGTYNLNEPNDRCGDANGEVASTNEASQNTSQIVTIRPTSSDLTMNNNDSYRTSVTTTIISKQQGDNTFPMKLPEITKTYYSENELEQIPFNLDFNVQTRSELGCKNSPESMLPYPEPMLPYPEPMLPYPEPEKQTYNVQPANILPYPETEHRVYLTEGSENFDSFPKSQSNAPIPGSTLHGYLRESGYNLRPVESIHHISESENYQISQSEFVFKSVIEPDYRYQVKLTEPSEMETSFRNVSICEDNNKNGEKIIKTTLQRNPAGALDNGISHLTNDSDFNDNKLHVLERIPPFEDSPFEKISV